MKKIISIQIIFSLMIACVFANIFAYPIFSRYTNITAKEVERLNNHYEIELYPPAEQITPPENTIEEKPSKNEEITVSNLNWFDSVYSLFPTYTKTRVIDIKSGLSYYVYRNGGSYHADVEPINKENTDIFYKIYNYQWSWTRRPVWVEIRPNFWVAASINGYPHGNAYIKNTGIDGHTCIHFLQSKTHGTKRVDEAHQAAVDYAYSHRDEIYKYL